MPPNTPGGNGDDNGDDDNDHSGTTKVPSPTAISTRSEITVSDCLISCTTYTTEGNSVTAGCNTICTSTHTGCSVTGITITTSTEAYSATGGAYTKYPKNVLDLPEPSADNDDYTGGDPNESDDAEPVINSGFSGMAKRASPQKVEVLGPAGQECKMQKVLKYPRVYRRRKTDELGTNTIKQSQVQGQSLVYHETTYRRYLYRGAG